MTEPHECNERCALIRACLDSAEALRERWTFQTIGNEVGLTRARIEQIVKAHGWTLHRLKTCPSCKTRYLESPPDHRAGLAHTTHLANLGPNLRDKLTHWDAMALGIAAYQAGYRYSELRLVTGRPPENIYRYMERLGLKPNRSGFGSYDRDSPYFDKARERQALILAMKDAGIPPKKIAADMGISQSYIYHLSKLHEHRSE